MGNNLRGANLKELQLLEQQIDDELLSVRERKVEALFPCF